MVGTPKFSKLKRGGDKERELCGDDWASPLRQDGEHSNPRGTSSYSATTHERISSPLALVGRPPLRLEGLPL